MALETTILCLNIGLVKIGMYLPLPFRTNIITKLNCHVCLIVSQLEEICNALQSMHENDNFQRNETFSKGTHYIMEFTKMGFDPVSGAYVSEDICYRTLIQSRNANACYHIVECTCNGFPQ